MPGKRRRRPIGELLRVLRHVSVHAGGEALGDGPGVLVEFLVDRHGASEGGSIHEVGVKRAPPLVGGELSACAKQSKRHALAVVLDLQVAQRVPEGSEVVGVDVRHAVRSPDDLDLPRQSGTRFVLAVRHWRPDQPSAGDQRQRDQVEPDCAMKRRDGTPGHR